MLSPKEMLRPAVHAWPRLVWERALFLSVILPTLLLGPLMGGRAIWIHAHDEQGAHLHFAPLQQTAEHEDLVGWHDALQHHHHDDDPQAGTPGGMVVRVPAFVAIPTPAAGQTAPRAFEVCTRSPSFLWDFAFSSSLCETEFYPSSWPPQDRWRSGVEELLRSSHALLI